MLAGEPLQYRLGRVIALEHHHHRLAKGPAQVRIADLLSAVARLFAVRLLSRLDQAAVGGKVLRARKAGDIFNLVEDNHAERERAETPIPDKGRRAKGVRH